MGKTATLDVAQYPASAAAGNDLNVTDDGAFTVKVVKGGTYDNVTLTAKSGGSIHVTGKLVVNGTLTLVADHSGTILLPAKVLCQKLYLTSTYSSNINSDDLEVEGYNQLDVSWASTGSLYLVIRSGEIAGSVSEHSTLNTWVDFPNGFKSDTVTTDHTSLYTRRGWSGPV